MNDNDHADETPQDRIAKVALYLESVARMPPEQFGTLRQAVHEMAHLNHAQHPWRNQTTQPQVRDMTTAQFC
ncbi:hypothetical protein [Streptomyces sp. NBC_01643]|uniref:hypothetical protein n=1 Tax=Streptomyces sp. NBC_01643 TaxID=2975906 RepID=UPI00386C86C6|nr:hypothetical protein OHB03_46385 [Streptomyces sp. NBC_01643]WTD39909.1 hypothetical protein OHB03_49765 [Streptomyces sp. NBC_01643]